MTLPPPTPRAKLELETVTGEDAQAALPDLARLRIEVFREFPYLYDGDEAHERDYLQTYVRVNGAAIVLARIGERIVGAATCLPLSAETEAVKTPFLEAGIDISDIFYFGESVLEKAYRGRGLGVGFFVARERQARAYGASLAAFCAVQRPASHWLRPDGYQPLDGFWTKRGFTRREDLVCQMSWRDVDEASATTKTLTFWTKRL
nr:GNAT family N-acetyltransferase [uncultured Acidocella sp.]